MTLKELDGVSKFTVIKNEDIEKYLNPIFRRKIRDVIDRIKIGRTVDRKSITNEYIVINIDEPYAPEVIEIMKKYKHWG